MTAAAQPPRFIDLSHSVTENLQTYPGLPAPHIFVHLDRDVAEAIYGPGVSFTIGMITICSNTGTYIDVPYHRFADGYDLTGLPLHRVASVPGICIDCRGINSIGPEHVADREVTGRAVLFRTDHSRHFATPAYLDNHPHLSAATAEALVAGGALCVGIDSLNIDAIESPDGDGRPVHTTLLMNNLPIIEHLTGLDALPPDGFRFTAVPPKIEGLGTFTVRAFGTI